jgi:hypothetical protein
MLSDARDVPEGLTSRAAAFLRQHATRETFAPDRAEESRQIEQAAKQYGLSAASIGSRLSAMQDRFGGLRYRSGSWSFEEVIEFWPVLDLDEEDPEPMVTLVEHTAAHPYGVWATLDGAVHFMYPGEHGGEYVHVFDRVEAIIEVDALLAECAEWIEVRRGGGDSIARVEAKVSALVRIDEASGHTESWWQGDGFRIYLWRTLGKVFGQPGDGQWAVWAKDDSAVERARSFLASQTSAGGSSRNGKAT